MQWAPWTNFPVAPDITAVSFDKTIPNRSRWESHGITGGITIDVPEQMAVEFIPIQPIEIDKAYKEQEYP